jgi:hypothetical protein
MLSWKKNMGMVFEFFFCGGDNLNQKEEKKNSPGKINAPLHLK